MTQKTYSGSCHCKKVRFETDVDLATGTLRCNCSICTKARSWFKLVAPSAFRVLEGEDSLSEYAWTSPGFPEPNLRYQFCKHCGIRVFVRGANNGKGEPFVALAIAALDDADPKELASSIRYVDGRQGRYANEPENIASL
jgi:hypothetical protein